MWHVPRTHFWCRTPAQDVSFPESQNILSGKNPQTQLLPCPEHPKNPLLFLSVVQTSRTLSGGSAHPKDTNSEFQHHRHLEGDQSHLELRKSFARNHQREKKKKMREKKEILREASTPPRSALASDLCLARSPYLVHLRVGPGLPGPKIQGVPGLSIPWRHPQGRGQGTFRHEAQTPHGARPGFRRLGSVRIRAWCHPQAL